MVSSGYLQVELQIFNSLINVFPECTLSFVCNTTCLKLGKSNDNKRCKCVSYLQQEVLIRSIGQEISVQEMQYTRTSDTRILTETQDRPDFHTLLLLLLPLGSEKAHDIQTAFEWTPEGKCESMKTALQGCGATYRIPVFSLLRCKGD